MGPSSLTIQPAATEDAGFIARIILLSQDARVAFTTDGILRYFTKSISTARFPSRFTPSP